MVYSGVLTWHQYEPERPGILYSEYLIPKRDGEVITGLAYMVHDTRQRHGDASHEEHVTPIRDDAEQQDVGHNPEGEGSPEN